MAKILIADDEPSVRTFVSRVIENMGHDVTVVENGKTAFEIFQKEAFDLSFVDINMPEMSGIQFLEEAKVLDPKAMVIIMTGFPSAETIIETIEDDGYTYVAKPLRIDQIQDLVQRGLQARQDRLKNE